MAYPTGGAHETVFRAFLGDGKRVLDARGECFGVHSQRAPQRLHGLCLDRTDRSPSTKRTLFDAQPLWWHLRHWLWKRKRVLEPWLAQWWLSLYTGFTSPASTARSVRTGPYWKLYRYTLNPMSDCSVCA
jgi:alpha-amylase/alpha-mannosidase (GH57 family)